MARYQPWDEQLAGGPLNQAALEHVQASFDTDRLLDAVDAVDATRYRVCEPDQLAPNLKVEGGTFDWALRGTRWTRA